MHSQAQKSTSQEPSAPRTALGQLARPTRGPQVGRESRSLVFEPLLDLPELGGVESRLAPDPSPLLARGTDYPELEEATHSRR